MAQIGSFGLVSKERNSVHDLIDAKYSSFEIDGSRYVQIDTFGRASRDMPEKVSQSLQLNAESARALFEILKSEFDLK